MIVTEKILNVQTGEETIIEREETADEKKARLSFDKSMADAEAERVRIESAKEVILNRLGLTAEEAKILIS